VMGSRRHTPGFVDRLRQAGADVSRLHSPTGLDLGARQPAEIALSILAEILAAARGRPGGSLDIVNASTAQPGGGAGAA
jgi:xanthine dehydrogenase accessory factor